MLIPLVHPQAQQTNEGTETKVGNGLDLVVSCSVPGQGGKALCVQFQCAISLWGYH